MIYIFWTCRNKTEAKQIIRALLDKRLVACASIFAEIESLYLWEGKIENSKEIKVLLKTSPDCFEKVSTYIQENGSYEVPEIAQIEISKVNPKYLRWLNLELKK